MKTTIRFENAVSKLYKAFHAGTLNPMDSCACAVGILAGGDGNWNGNINNEDLSINVPLKYQKMTGYSATELRNVESLFMGGAKGWFPWFDQITVIKNFTCHQGDKDSQSLGLCAVVEYLAELDKIPNPMDYKSLFETENDKPKLELSSVF